jgi:hypothetical protein
MEESANTRLLRRKCVRRVIFIYSLVSRRQDIKCKLEGWTAGARTVRATQVNK